MHKLIRHLAQVNAFLLILCVIFALAALVAWYALTEIYGKAQIRCADFSSYQDIRDAFNSGADYLDKNNNGIPCESML